MIILEIILILFVILLLDPKNSMKYLRRAGYYFGKLTNFINTFKDIGSEFNLKNMEQQVRRESGHNYEKTSNPPDINNNYSEIRSSHNGIQGINRVLLNGYFDILRKKYDYRHTKMLVPLLFEEDSGISSKVFELLKIDPVFGFEKRGLVLPVTDLKVDHLRDNMFLHLFSDERIKDLSNIFYSIPDDVFKKRLPLIALFPGIDNLNINDIFTKSKAKFYQDYQIERSKYYETTYPQILTIAPSYDCNLNCQYCFSRELNKRFKQMSIDQFREILDTLERQGKNKEIAFFGGEPTYFPEILVFFKELESRELSFTLATNCLVNTEKWECLVRYSGLVNITAHIEKDSFYRERSEIDQIACNLSIASRENKRVVFRYNIDKSEPIDWSFLERYIRSVREFIFSFAIPFPSQVSTNTFVDLNDINSYSSNILSMIRFIKEKCRYKRHLIVLAKPIPLCAFSNEVFEELLANIQFKNICEIDQNGYTNNLIINPDGSYNPCMALNSVTYTFDSFTDTEILPSSYYSKLQNIMRVPLMENCEKCRLKYIGICQAGCFSYAGHK